MIARSGLVLAALLIPGTAATHEAERTRVTLTLQSDGHFVLDVANDPAWLLLRLETFAGGRVPPNITPAARDARLAELEPAFADRIVLFVDAHEVRATSATGRSVRPLASARRRSARVRIPGMSPGAASTGKSC